MGMGICLVRKGSEEEEERRRVVWIEENYRQEGRYLYEIPNLDLYYL
jgi:hypothetical protein